MKVRFAPFITLSISHGYYAAACGDVELVPNAATRDLLRNARVRLRAQPGQLSLFYEQDTASAQPEPLVNLAGNTLDFGLRVVNPYFSNVTTPLLADVGLIPRYQNAAVAQTLDAPVGVALLAGSYEHTLSLAQRPVTLQLVRVPANSVLDVRTLESGSTSYDLRQLPSGPYLLREDYGAGVTRQRELFIDEEFARAGVMGVVSLKLDATFYQTAPEFVLRFEARQEQLRYYVVARNWSSQDLAELAVVDEGFLSEGRAQLLFSSFLTLPQPPRFATANALADAASRVAVFESNAAVARRERGLQRLRLNRGSTVLIQHLPSPAPERASAELIVHLSKP